MHVNELILPLQRRLLPGARVCIPLPTSVAQVSCSKMDVSDASSIQLLRELT